MAAILVHVMDKASFAVLAFLLLLYGTVSSLVVMAMPENVLFFLPKQSLGERKATAWQVARILGLLGVAASAVILACGLLPDLVFAEVPLAARYAPLMAAYALFDVPALMLPNLLIAEDRHRWASWVSIFQTAGQILAVLIPCILGMPLWAPLALLSGYGIVHLAALLLALYLLYRDTKATPCPVTLREHLSFAVPLGLSGIVAKVTSQFDKYVVLYVIGVMAFTDYSVGAWEIPLVNVLPFSIGAAIVPVLVRSFAQGRRREALETWKSTIPKTSLLVVPISFVFLICADDFIQLLFGRAYLGATVPLRLYPVILLWRVVEYGAILRAGGDTKALLNLILILFLSNAVLSIPLAYLVGPTARRCDRARHVPTMAYVLHRIARLTDSSMRTVFPWAAYGRVLGIAAAVAVPAVAFRWAVTLSPAADFAVVGVGYLTLFALVASLAGTIRREDWAFVGRWLSMRQLVAGGGGATVGIATAPPAATGGRSPGDRGPTSA